MQNVSNAFREIMKGREFERVIKATLQTPTATYELTDSDIVSGSMSVTSACFDKNFELGRMMFSDLDISLKNTDGKWNNILLDGATIRPYSGLVLPDGTEEYVPLGVFIIDQPGRPYSQVSIRASDRLVLLDTPFSRVSVSYPASLRQIADAISAFCNVPLSSSIYALKNINYSVTEAPAENLSCRDVMEMIAIINCGYGRMTRSGALEIVSFRKIPFDDFIDGNGDGTYLIDGNGDGEFVLGGADFSFVPESEKPGNIEDMEMGRGSRYDFKALTDMIVVTGIEYDNLTEFLLLGSDQRYLQIANIPLLQHDVESILSDIYEAVVGFRYVALTATYPGNPAIDAGDMIRHITMDDRDIVSIVSTHVFRHGGKSTIRADGTGTVASDYRGQNTRRLTALAGQVKETENRLTTYQQASARFNELVTQSMGFFTTEEIQPDGSIIAYQHNQPTLAESQVIYRKSADTMAWSNDGGQTWRGMDAEGNILAKVLTAIGINAEWINVGELNAARIGAGSITAAKIAASAITSDKIQAGAVTAGKIAANAVTATEIAANAVTASEIAAGAVTANKINVNSLSAVSADLGTVTAGTITGTTITGNTIAGGTITGSEVYGAVFSGNNGNVFSMKVGDNPNPGMAAYRGILGFMSNYSATEPYFTLTTSYAGGAGTRATMLTSFGSTLNFGYVPSANWNFSSMSAESGNQRARAYATTTSNSADAHIGKVNASNTLINGVGGDDTGPYYVKNGVKTYF